MILIISKKNDLISYGFYKAFKTIYKNVDIIYDIKQLFDINKYKSIIVNNYDFANKLPIIDNLKYILINENCLFENKLKNNNINYLIIKEYSIQYDLSNFKKIDKYMYFNNNIVIMPFCSIFTKNEILWHYKKNLIINKKIPECLLTYENLNMNDVVKINYIKINKKNTEDIINKCFNEKNIYLNTYDVNKFNYKSISFMALGNYTMTNSNIDDIFYTLNFKNDTQIDFNKIVQNIELIYNDFTFEKYVKLLNTLNY